MKFYNEFLETFPKISPQNAILPHKEFFKFENYD